MSVFSPSSRRSSPKLDFKSLLLQKLCFSQVFAGQAVGIKEIQDDIWLVSFMNYDLGYIDLEEKTLQTLGNPFGPKV